LTANPTVATVLGSILAFVRKVESEGRHMKQCLIQYLEKTKKTFYFSYVETAGKMDVGRGTFVWSLSSLAAVFVCGHGVQRVTRWSGNLQSSSTRYSKIGSQFIPSLVSTLSGSWSFLDSWSRFQDKQGDGSRIRIHNIQKY